MATHAQTVKNLTPADYLLIEEEHAALEGLLSDLHDTCCNLDSLLSCESCSSEKLASCQGRLPSFSFDLIELAGRHFYHEESIMLSRPHVTEEYEYFRAHRQAHANIMRGLTVAVNACAALGKDGNTAEGYRQFCQKTSELLEEHNRAFDDPFIQSTKA